MEVKVLADPDAVADTAAELIADAVSTAAARFNLGLAGGSTPAATYQRLRDANLAWDRVDAWLSDERWVPDDHPDSNGHQAATILLNHVEADFYRPRWAPWLTPADSAAHYEATLRSVIPDRRPDLVMLGIGDDGHTASLFPGTRALNDLSTRWIVDNYVPRLDAERLTATRHLISQAKHLLFIVTGEGKAEALRQVLEPQADEAPLPAMLVTEAATKVTWIIDANAAKHLDRAG